MTKQSLPAVSTLTAETIEEFKTADKVVLIAYFAADDKESNSTFNAAADLMRDDYLFGATNDAALAQAEGVKQPSVVLYKDFDEGKNVFEENFDVDAISQFAQTSSTPLVGEVGPETYAGYMAVSVGDCSPVHPGANDDQGWHSSCVYFRRNSRGTDEIGWRAQGSRRETQGQDQLCNH